MYNISNYADSNKQSAYLNELNSIQFFFDNLMLKKRVRNLEQLISEIKINQKHY